MLHKTCNALPQRFRDWFAARGWMPHAHQLALLDADRVGESALLVAPTGGGKTLAGFRPTLIALAETPRAGLHTLYVSPLKALAVDIHRNLDQPIAEIALSISSETRTGDTPPAKRQRQHRRPPNILLTTPESLALLLSYQDAPTMFATVERFVVDELHALAGTKRGDLLSLGAPACGASPRTSGASACRRPSPTNKASPTGCRRCEAQCVSFTAARAPSRRFASSIHASSCPGPATRPCSPWAKSTRPSARIAPRWCS
jgi:hypothetical protein